MHGLLRQRALASPQREREFPGASQISSVAAIQHRIGSQRGPSTIAFVCQNCGAAYGRWQGKCDACGEWNTHRRGRRRARRRRPRHGAAQGPAVRARASVRRDAGRAPPRLRHCRIRSRHRRRLCARLGAAARRRSRHRQIDAADPGRGDARAAPASAPSISPAKKRSRRCGCAPSGSASPSAPVELAAETSVEDIIATLSEGETPRLVVIDSIQTMWTDMVEFGAGHGHPGARLRAGADPLRQALRRRRDAGRPRHQGRPDRRPARGRAHGRRGDVVRGRRLRTSSASCARSRTASARPTRSACSR